MKVPKLANAKPAKLYSSTLADEKTGKAFDERQIFLKVSVGEYLYRKEIVTNQKKILESE